MLEDGTFSGYVIDIDSNRSQENIKGSTMASDAFFPFRDGIDIAAEAGVTSIIDGPLPIMNIVSLFLNSRASSKLMILY